MNKNIFNLLILCGISSYAQTNKDTIVLQETIISASRWEQAVKSIPTHAMGISNKEISTQNQQTTADLLQNTGQIFVQKSQTGGGSAVLRGFEASRISLIVDGVRMNNAMYRMGHLQDVITVDQCMLEKTEILFGPSSTMYGSDALGGVIHFYTRQPKLNKIGGSALTRYSTANSEKTGHFDLNLGFGKLASLTSITYSDFGDLHIGNQFNAKYGDWGKCLYFVTRENGKDVVNTNTKPNVMIGSAYKQYDVLQKLLFKLNENVTHELNIQLSNNVGNVPRYDRMLELSNGKPKYAENYYGPQTRLFAAYTLDINKRTSFFDDAKLIFSTQKINQDRMSRKLNSNSRSSNFEDALIYALNFDLTRKLADNINLYYGAELIYNDIKSTASSTNMTDGSVTWNKDDKTIATRYADGGSQWSSIAAYLQANHQLSDIFSTTAGFRLSSVGLTSNYTDNSAYPVTKVSSNAVAPSGTLGLVANLPSSTKICVLGSTGFRAPNVEDMTAFTGASAGMARVPNSNLKPESAYNVELNLTQKLGSVLKFETGTYYTILQNVMVVRDTKFNSSDSVSINGIQFKAQSIQNADNGIIYGWYANAKVNLTYEWSIAGSVAGTYGNYTATNGSKDGLKDTVVAMDHIPPIFGKIGINYKTNRLGVEAFARFSAEKKLADYSPSGEDNLPQAASTIDASQKFTIPVGTPSWYTLNLRTSYELFTNISINAGVENILDTHYRQFASGISAPGRNIYFSLRANF